MRRILLAAAGLALVLPLTRPAAAEDLAARIVGVWKVTDFHTKEVATGKITYPFGEQPAGYQAYTKGGRFFALLVAAGRAKPAGPSLTDAERAGLHKTMVATTGTYKVDGDTLVTTFEASWNQAWTGTTQKRQIEIAGDRLTLTSAPIRSTLTGQDIISVATMVRAE